MKDLLKENVYNDVVSILNEEIDFSLFKNKSILITGTSKLLGYYLSCALLINNDINASNSKIIAVDKDKNLFEKFGKLTSRVDLEFIVSEDFDNLQGEKVDYIIHTDTSDNTSNIAAITNLLEFAEKSKVENILITTDANIYGTVYNGKQEISEDDCGYVDLQTDKGYHAQSQRTMENLFSLFCKNHSITLKKVRLCNVFGGFKNSENDKTYEVFSNAINRKNITINQEDSKIESYCYVTDAVLNIFKVLLSSKESNTFNIASNISTSIKEIAQNCNNMYADYNVKVILKNKGNITSSPMSPTKKVLSTQRLNTVGIKPKLTLEESIIRSIKIIEENQ